MTNRNKTLKARKRLLNWEKMGMFSDKMCPDCGQATLIQIYKHDAWACITCNEWHDEVCDDPECSYCSNRPKTPYEVYWNENVETNNISGQKMWRRSNYQHKKDGEIKHKNKSR